MNLRHLYDRLDLKQGLGLYEVSKRADVSEVDGLDKGEWLELAARLGVEALYFLDNNPVAVFAQADGNHESQAKAFNQAWCMARPRLLFLAAQGEITVYDLAAKPVDLIRESPDEWQEGRLLDVLYHAKEFASEVSRYHRSQLETGKLFEGEERFAAMKYRADKALLADLKTVRRDLIESGLSPRYAHAIIGRSIFIRYLEDRGILKADYFGHAAEGHAKWQALLQEPKNNDFSGKSNLFAKVLSNHAFTYALFRQLAVDFNGDMFPQDADEERSVKQVHLTQLQGLLYGETGRQRKLFFYSYDFSIVPLSLISAIYEEFYHDAEAESKESPPKKSRSKARQDGAFYTPPVLAEFVTSILLTPGVLAVKPRILDPACGSGIFLVEAFRRIVRHRRLQLNKRLSFDQLRNILRDQIAGIDVNEEACRVAAFSLYLAFLHYQEPNDILALKNEKKKILPNLLFSGIKDEKHLDCLLTSNAFEETGQGMGGGRFNDGSFDIVIGNPPWGSLGTTKNDIAKTRERIMLAWCKRNAKPIGDKEASQAFALRSVAFLRQSGVAGLLLSTGVLLKHSEPSRKFRQEWMRTAQLDSVYNFSNVRHLFFKGANSPFLAVFFRKTQEEPSQLLTYWCAKQTAMVSGLQSVLFATYDRAIVNRKDVQKSEIWKLLWYGRTNDVRFVERLKQLRRLEDVVDRGRSGRGFELCGNKMTFPTKMPRLDQDSFTRYAALNCGLESPDKVYRVGTIDAFNDDRILVGRGINEKGENKGLIIARYEHEAFCFSNAIIGLKLQEPSTWKYKLLLGILWSSLSRYWFFLTCSNWGVWHHEIHLDDELLQLPIVLDKQHPATTEIIALVDQLRQLSAKFRLSADDADIHTLERKLDVSVFELYGLTPVEIDLVRDCCDVTLPLFYNAEKSVGCCPVEKSELKQYAVTFARNWKTSLPEGQEFRVTWHISSDGLMLAAEFYPCDSNDPWDVQLCRNSYDETLSQLGEQLVTPMGTERIMLDGFAYAVTARAVVLVKRNERRYWTRSLAREDAETTLCKSLLSSALTKKGVRR